MNIVRKMLVVVSTILLCVAFGLLCYFALEGGVKAESITRYSTSSDFGNYYVITNDKLTNNANNVYNSNSSLISTITISNNEHLLSGGNYIFLNKIGLNFSNLTQNDFYNMPDRFNYHFGTSVSAYPIFYFRGLFPDNSGVIVSKEFGFGRDLTFVKLVYFPNVAVYEVYLDMSDFDDFMPEIVDYSVNNGSFSFSYNSNFNDSGLYIDNITFYDWHTGTSFLTNAFSSAGYGFRYPISSVTYTDWEFDTNIHFNWDYTNSYYGNINFVACENYSIDNDGSTIGSSLQPFTQFTYKSNNNNLVIFPNIPSSYGRNPVFDSHQYPNTYSLSITSKSSTGLLLTDIDSIHSDNHWTNNYLRKRFNFWYNQNLDSLMSFVDIYDNDYSSGLYKSDVAWYDIFGHLYNFLIYLIFDMPLISNITKPIYMLISSTTTTFNWLAGCVAGLGIFGAFAMVGLLFAIINRFL